MKEDGEMPLLESRTAELFWLCDGCQRQFESGWDDETEKQSGISQA